MSDVKSPKSPRRYASRLRTELAERTRSEIVMASLELFLAQGYVATTVDQIAERVGVSRPTVFAVGTKAQLFKLARDRAIAGDDDPRSMAERPAHEEFAAAEDPETALRRFARLSAGIARRFAPLNEVLRQGAAVDKQLADLWQQSEAERLVAARGVIKIVAAKGPLRSGLDDRAAADILWLLMAPDQHHRLVADRAWSNARFERWYADTMVRLILPEPDNRNSGRRGRSFSTRA
ncbi:MAG TPA: helix-turn-helix domain-containing protein [Acidimicrobiales bacterium]|nr:helix-turn-helix domain-containing protein [Acidimicrobiales bacterium]